jgi:hypothetical protein
MVGAAVGPIALSCGSAEVSNAEESVKSKGSLSNEYSIRPGSKAVDRYMLGSASSNHFRAEHSRFSVRSNNVTIIKITGNIILNGYSGCIHCALLLSTWKDERRRGHKKQGARKATDRNFASSTVDETTTFQTAERIVRERVCSTVIGQVLVQCHSWRCTLHAILRSQYRTIRPARDRSKCKLAPCTSNVRVQ